MTDNEDGENEFRAVLGPLFEELSTLNPFSLTMDEILTEAEKKRIRLHTYMVQVPISGDYALDLAASVDHSSGGCIECDAFLTDFAIRFIIGLWETIMQSLEMGEE